MSIHVNLKMITWTVTQFVLFNTLLGVHLLILVLEAFIVLLKPCQVIKIYIKKTTLVENKKNTTHIVH